MHANNNSIYTDIHTHIQVSHKFPSKPGLGTCFHDANTGWYKILRPNVHLPWESFTRSLFHPPTDHPLMAPEERMWH